MRSLLAAGLVAAVQLGHGGAEGYAGLLVACLRVLEGLHLLGLEVSAEFNYLLHVPVTKLGELVEPLGALDPEFSAEALDLVGEVIPLFDGQAKLTLEFLNVDVRLGRRRRRLGQLGGRGLGEEVTVTNPKHLQDPG